MKINTKNKLLYLGILVMLVLSYQLAIKNTLKVRKDLINLKIDAQKTKDIPKEMSVLTLKEKYYDSILVKMDIGHSSVQNKLLHLINNEAEKNEIDVIDFNQPHISAIDEINLNTYSINLKGSFTNILKVIHSIEKKGNFGEIIHIDFQKKKNYKTNTFNLEATVFVQQVK